MRCEVSRKTALDTIFNISFVRGAARGGFRGACFHGFVGQNVASQFAMIACCVMYSIVFFVLCLFSCREWSCMVSFRFSLSCHVVSCGFFYDLVLVCIISHCLVSFCFVVLCRVEPCRVRSCISFCLVCVFGWLCLVVTLDVSCFWLWLW